MSDSRHTASAVRTAWTRALTRLIERASCDLPRDVERAMQRARRNENNGSHAAAILDTLLENTRIARGERKPICQDTGTPTFWFRVPRGTDTTGLASCARRAVARATQQGWLRRNTLDGLTGAPIDTNLGRHTPVLHFRPGAGTGITVHLLLKGGGCENTGRQYALPCAALEAGRDLDGVRRCVLDAVWRAQGTGCAPGILGVCIGGDRAQGFEQAKQQLLRPIAHRAAQPELAALELRLGEEINRLGIGPMGMGGAPTILDVKLSAAERLPASFFVTVAILCWAGRRAAFQATREGRILRWSARPPFPS